MIISLANQMFMDKLMLHFHSKVTHQGLDYEEIVKLKSMLLT